MRYPDGPGGDGSRGRRQAHTCGVSGSREDDRTRGFFVFFFRPAIGSRKIKSFSDNFGVNTRSENVKLAGSRPILSTVDHRAPRGPKLAGFDWRGSDQEVATLVLVTRGSEATSGGLNALLGYKRSMCSTWGRPRSTSAVWGHTSERGFLSDRWHACRIFKFSFS